MKLRTEVMMTVRLARRMNICEILRLMDTTIVM